MRKPQNSHFSSRAPSCWFPFDSRRFSADNHAQTFRINIRPNKKGGVTSLCLPSRQRKIGWFWKFLYSEYLLSHQLYAPAQSMGSPGWCTRTPVRMVRLTLIGAWFLFLLPHLTIFGLGRPSGRSPTKSTYPKSGIVFSFSSIIVYLCWGLNNNCMQRYG